MLEKVAIHTMIDADDHFLLMIKRKFFLVRGVRFYQKSWWVTHKIVKKSESNFTVCTSDLSRDGVFMSI